MPNNITSLVVNYNALRDFSAFFPYGATFSLSDYVMCHVRSSVMACVPLSILPLHVHQKYILVHTFLRNSTNSCRFMLVVIATQMCCNTSIIHTHSMILYIVYVNSCHASCIF